MTDDTLRTNQAADNSEKPETVQERLRQLSRRTTELIELLNSQREILRKRGMNLPSGAIDNLRMLKMKVDGLARTIVSTQIELQQLRGLARSTALINSSLETEEVLNQVMDTVIQLVGAERGYIVLKNEETGELEFVVSRGMDQEQLDKRKELVVSKTIVNQVATTGEPLLTDNASQDERYQGQQSIVGFALRSILAVPLKVRDEVIGVVYCDNRIIAALFKQHELQVLTAFAHQAAVAIDNARLFEAARARLAQVSKVRDLMKNLFTSIGSGVITLDNDSRVMVANDSAKRMLGVDQPEGKTLDELIPMNDDLATALKRVHIEGAQVHITLEPVLNGSGQRFWNMAISPLRDANNISFGVALVVDDLTEQKQRESQLAEVRRYLPLALVRNIHSVDQFNNSGQEREITAFSSDVRGFTTFSERLEPEVLMQIINKYLSLASDAINLYEGIVDKYMGDAVTGLFNTHLNPQPDHAERAVQAALQLIYDLHAQHEVMPEDERLFYGIGIHTGPAVLGNAGGTERKEFSALGDAVNISKYLEGNAGPGQVVISGSTYQLVKDTFECELVTELRRPKKGYEHIEVYRVIKRKKGASALMFDAELMELLDELKDK